MYCYYMLSRMKNQNFLILLFQIRKSRKFRTLSQRPVDDNQPRAHRGDVVVNSFLVNGPSDGYGRQNFESKEKFVFSNLSDSKFDNCSSQEVYQISPNDEMRSLNADQNVSKNEKRFERYQKKVKLVN